MSLASESAVLRICRAYKGGWCMRERRATSGLLALNPCVVVDNSRFSSPTIAEGADWEEVLERLRNHPTVLRMQREGYLKGGLS